MLTLILDVHLILNFGHVLQNIKNAYDYQKCRHQLRSVISIPCFIALDCISLDRCSTFYKLNICVNPTSSQSIGVIFSKSSYLLHVSVSHFGNSCNISNFFIIVIICYADLRSIIFDVTIAKRLDLLKAQIMV